MMAGGWFFFTNWQVDVTSNSPQLVPRSPTAGASGPIFSPSSSNSPFNSASPVTTPPPVNPNTLTPPVVNNPTGTGNNPLGSLLNAAGQMLSRSNQPTGNNTNLNPPPTVPAARGRENIRIASFNIQVFGEQKMSQTDVVNVLANVIRNFDIVAIQEVRSRTQDILPNFVQAINATGRHYDHVIGERLGRTNSKEQYAFVFDTETVEIDRRSLYTVNDPDDLIHREPLVGWFRCRGVDPREAFTFTLVNIHVDPDEVSVTNSTSEINVLDDIFRAVRDDGRGEDDVILLGDFNANDQHFGQIARMPNITWVVNNQPTNTRGNAQFDNLIFDKLGTREFTGRGGVFDYMREYNLSLEQALRVSDHLVVWGEFSVFEGGVNGRVANRPGYSYNAPAQYQNQSPYGEDYHQPRVAQYAQRYAAQPGYGQAPQYQEYYHAPATSQSPSPYGRAEQGYPADYYNQARRPTYQQPNYPQPSYGPQTSYGQATYGQPGYHQDPRYSQQYRAPSYTQPTGQGQYYRPPTTRSGTPQW
jgi:endonuclease/exonuclease/phosphatase family metal-dependent hydrolase